MGGDGRKLPACLILFSDKKHFFPLSSHLMLTEATAITSCHPFDSFCHQLAAKSASPKTRKPGNLYVCYLSLPCILYVWVLPSHLCLSFCLYLCLCVFLLCLSSQMHVSPFAQRSVLMGGDKSAPLPLWGSLSPDFYQPVLLENLQDVNKLLMRWAKLFAGPCHSFLGFSLSDGSLNEEMFVTGALCYHSIKLKTQTGHCAAIMPVIYSALWCCMRFSFLICRPCPSMTTVSLSNLHLHNQAKKTYDYRNRWKGSEKMCKLMFVNKLQKEPLLTWLTLFYII